MLRYVHVAAACLTFLALLPSSAHAQASIAGAARDASGAVLPGVTVEAASPALIEKVRVAVTDGSGQYRIENLRPGDYRVTFALPGFATVIRDGIQLTGSAVATVNADLRVGALEETITVTGAVPMVDVQSTVRQRVLDREVLDVLPASRAAAQVAGLTANVVTTSLDVGGVSGDGSSRGDIITRGVADSRVMMGGLVTQTGTGTSHGFYNMEAYQEVAVDTGAADVENYAGGVRINFIPKDGGNTFSGSLMTAFANSDMAGDNVTEELREAGLGTPNTVKRLLDINPSLGGPIVRDRLWFHVAGRYDQAYNYVPVFFNKHAGNPDVWIYEPDLGQEPAAIENTIKNIDTRVTWQATPTHKFAATYDNSHICDCPRRIRANESPESVLGVYNINPRYFFGGEWTAPLTERVLIEANFVRIHSDASRARVNPYFAPSPVPLVAVQEQNGNLRYRGTSSANSSVNDPLQGRTVLSYITGSHAFKVGANFGTLAQSRETFSPDAPMLFRFRNGVPNRITLEDTPFTAEASGIEYGIFVQDRWTVRRLTVTAGLRYDRLSVTFPEQTVGPGAFSPNRNFTFRETKGVQWHDIEPRLGLAMDLFGNGRTALKVSLNKYLAGEGSGGLFGIGQAPINQLVASTNRSWRDADGDYVPDCNLTNPARNGECGAMADESFGSTIPATVFDPDMLDGWSNRNYNWQFSTGVQQEIAPRVSVGVDYWRTWYGNFVVTQHRAYSPEDFDEYSITAPVDPRLPGGGGYVIGGLFDVKPDAFGRAADGFVTLSDNFGKRTEHWTGVDVTLNARPRAGLLLQGGTSTFRQSTNNCEVVRLSAGPPPERGGGLPGYNPSQHFCDVTGSFLTQIKMLGSYTIPQVDVQFTASLQNLPGPPITAIYTAPNAEVQASLGRPLSGGEGSVDVALVEPRSMYGDRINQLDLRIAKILRFGTTRTTLGLDLYNAFNSAAVLEVNDAFDEWQSPLAILNARFAKLVVQFNF